jgi:hypothetical protein
MKEDPTSTPYALTYVSNLRILVVQSVVLLTTLTHVFATIRDRTLRCPAEYTLSDANKIKIVPDGARDGLVQLRPEYQLLRRKVIAFSR